MTDEFEATLWSCLLSLPTSNVTCLQTIVGTIPLSPATHNPELYRRTSKVCAAQKPATTKHVAYRICPVRCTLFDVALSVAKWEREGWRHGYECRHWMSKRSMFGKERGWVGTGAKLSALDEARQTKLHGLSLAFLVLLHRKV